MPHTIFSSIIDFQDIVTTLLYLFIYLFISIPAGVNSSNLYICSSHRLRRTDSPTIAGFK